MESKKSHCEICDIGVSTPNYSKHFETKKRLLNEQERFFQLDKLRHWAKQNYIYNYQNLLHKDLKHIKQNFDKNNYNLFDNVYLNQIGEKLYVINLENLSRNELINRLEKINSYPENLSLRNNEYRDKNNDKLIYKETDVCIEEKIYQKRIL